MLPKNQLNAVCHVSEPAGHHSFAQALSHLTMLTDELGANLHGAINIARPHLVADPRDVDKAPMSEAPTPLASPVCLEIRAVNARLEGFIELLKRFGNNFDT